MKETTKYMFQGNPEHRPPNPHSDSPKKLEMYIAEPELIQAVNLAIYLKRPLLLEGEAGCGKTRLAYAVAYELGLPLYRWDIRSTSKVIEGLYTYDAILRLYDVQIAKIEAKLNRDPSDTRSYRKLGALGKAFLVKDCPAVVLIDEIDKADVDFPNDLLAVLDEPWQFEIPETDEVIRASYPPIVIITSNREKGNLPAPFLRRCLYYFISFPTHDQLQAIAKAHYQTQAETSPPSEELIQVAANQFLEIREAGELFKNPGTSEFLDWLKVLHSFGAKPYNLSKLSQADPVPYRELLFKLRVDWQKYAPVS
jgi:MoxR-like ATPase